MMPPQLGAGDAIAAACEALNRSIDHALSAGWTVSLGQETVNRQVAVPGGWPRDCSTLHVTVELSRKVGP
jgi:hypothetical protein